MNIKGTTALERRAAELHLREQDAVDSVLKIEDIPDEGLLLRVERPATWFAEDVPLSREVKAALLLFRIAQDVTADVDARTALTLECGRCLKQFETPVHLEFRQIYLPMKDEEVADEEELADDDLGVTFYRKPEIELDDLFREELILSIPLQPLCSTDCPGLCPHCGADLATAPCTCSQARDERLSPLAGLLDSMKKDINRRTD